MLAPPCELHWAVDEICLEHLSAGNDRFFNLEMSSRCTGGLVLLVLPLLWAIVGVNFDFWCCSLSSLRLQAANYLTEQTANL